MGPCPMISTPSASPSAKPAQARDDFAQVMDELDFVKELITGFPTRSGHAP